MITPPAVRQLAESLAARGQGLPAYAYDLAGLRTHVAAIRATLPESIELWYAAKANPDPPLLGVLAGYVDGVEVSSGGELAHVRRTLPGMPLSLGGPGKTDEELRAAISAGVARVHVESPHQLRRLAAAARQAGREVDVLLRINLPVDIGGAALSMNGPFGMDSTAMDECAGELAAARWLRLRGVHAHLASGLDAPTLLDLARIVLAWARPWCTWHAVENPEFNLGGGMAVNYERPGDRFDWAAYGCGLAELARSGETLRVEPGRAVTAYCGWYLANVIDVKRTHGQVFAVVAGGTQHLRTPVTKGHDQPFTVMDLGGADGPGVSDAEVTVVGQLCTPKDVFATRVGVERIAVGDVIAFELAGAYAWNISHHEFLMHPVPTFHYLDES